MPALGPFTPGNANTQFAKCYPRNVGGLNNAIPSTWQDQRQFTGRYAPLQPVSGPYEQTTPPLRNMGGAIHAHVDPDDGTSTWWTVNLYGAQATRQVGIAPVGPLTFAQVVNQGQRATVAKARIIWEMFEFARSVDVDIGTGIRLDVQAASVRVEWLVPPDGGFIESEAARENGLGFNEGLIQDVIVGGSCIPSFAPTGHHEATFTDRVVNVAAGTTRLIPAGAKRLTIYSDDNNGFLFPFEWVPTIEFATLVSIVPAGVRSQVIFDAAARRVDHIEVPQDSVAISIPATDEDRFGWTLVWEIDL